MSRGLRAPFGSPRQSPQTEAPLGSQLRAGADQKNACLHTARVPQQTTHVGGGSGGAPARTHIALHVGECGRAAGVEWRCGWAVIFAGGAGLWYGIRSPADRSHLFCRVLSVRPSLSRCSVWGGEKRIPHSFGGRGSLKYLSEPVPLQAPAELGSCRGSGA